LANIRKECVKSLMKLSKRISVILSGDGRRQTANSR